MLIVDLIGFLFTAQLGSAQPAAKPATPPPAPVTATQGKLSALDVVTNVQKFYAGIQQVTAQFQQTVHISTFGTDKTSGGSVWIVKPGKMRWDYLETKGTNVVVKKSFISNGTNLYVVEHDNKQVVTKNLQQDLMPVAVSFLYGKGDLKAEFNAVLDDKSSYGGKGDYVLKLTPKKPSAQYKNLYLVADPTQFRVKESVIIDSSNNVNHFQFYKPDFEKPVKDTWFEFNKASVPNYRIVDGDAPQNQGSAAPAPAPAPAIPPKK
ncbi:MAG: outer membrane lipoprotein carrier protein LolA [Kofleriaceae bacterium]